MVWVVINGFNTNSYRIHNQIVWFKKLNFFFKLGDQEKDQENKKKKEKDQDKKKEKKNEKEPGDPVWSEKQGVSGRWLDTISLSRENALQCIQVQCSTL